MNKICGDDCPDDRAEQQQKAHVQVSEGHMLACKPSFLVKCLPRVSFVVLTGGFDVLR